MDKRKHIFEIPTINDGAADFLALINLHNKIIKSLERITPEEYDIKLSFSNCNFIRQNAIAYLGAISTFLKDKGFIVYYDFNSMKDSIVNILKADGFLGNNFGGRFANNYEHSDKAVPFKNFKGDLQTNEQLSGSIVDYVSKEWLKDSRISIKPALKNDLCAKMYELFANALEHSNSNLGCFACGQTYSSGEKDETVLTIVDLGIGIANSVKKYIENTGKSIENDEAIKWAFKNGNTTRPDQSGGIGLALVYDFLKLNNGFMDVYCNNVSLRIDKGKRNVRFIDADFSGTMINIRIWHSENTSYGYREEFE